MSNNPSFSELFASARASLPYKVERAIILFTEGVIGRMETLNLSRTDLAEKLESSPSYVTKFLRGGTNFTLESMIKVATSLDCDLKVELVSKSSPTEWFKRWESQQPKGRADIRAWTHVAQVKSGAAWRRGGVGHVECPPPPQCIYIQDNY